MTDHAFDLLMIRLVVAVEKLAGIEQPKTETKPTKVDVKRDVSVIDRRPEPETNPGLLGQGGTDPDAFWKRGDPDAAAMKRPARKMGRPLR
jgi:hypothetical protein